MRWLHVAPSRWADAASGKVSSRARARMVAHAATCARCQLAKERIDAARAAMDAMRDAPAPELPWDTIRAKLRWDRSGSSVSLPQAAPALWRRRGVWAGGLVAAAAVAAVALWPAARRLSPPSTLAVVAPAPSAPAPSAPAELVGLVTRARGVAQVDGERSLATLFSRTLGAGAVLATAEGALDVQLGEATALSLGPRSTLRLERLDAQAIELALDGLVDLEVAPRLPGQRFLIRAGAQTVEVRGTRFRVEHRADTTYISCRHGLVTVRDGATAVDVGAGASATLRTGEAPVTAQLVDRELVALAVATPYAVPWDRPEAVLAGSARLELSASADRRVRVDGLELGSGAFAVRVLRGRHLVEAADKGGAFRRLGWAEIGAGVDQARFFADEPTEPTATARAARKAELRRGLDRRALARCVRPIAKQGVSDTFITVELAVDRLGAIGVLNILDTDLPVEVAECVRTSLAATPFGAGPAARISERIDL